MTNDDRNAASRRATYMTMTLAQALNAEMNRRGHSATDAGREMGTSDVQVGRWAERYKGDSGFPFPDGRSPESMRAIRALVRYLGLRDEMDFAPIMMRTLLERERRDS